ncbi:LytR/AlgR family response regulator transcription factor [Pararhodonellum marinum]|uniref:LytR/AlgR family response regulator transcription factor n=1 Tax=Pararhodonellum marinum TaxID=2755358 RepID=UPI00188F4076|nr:LytTR family DNA-binding domain-containing protein [Pararhodonellum marinum]
MNSNKMYTCVIVDDEFHARELLKNHLGVLPSLRLLAVFDNSIEALSYLMGKDVDLLFVDIQIPIMLGTDLVKSLVHPPKVIFTTAHKDYAFDGFELNAVDFLLKPISLDRFLKAVQKALSMDMLGQVSQPVEPNKDSPFVIIRADRMNHKIPLTSILYVECLKDYLKIYTDDKCLMTKMPLGSFLQLLPKKDFIRVHRSYLVSKKKIEAYNSYHINIGKEEIPVGPNYRELLFSELGSRIG